MKYLVSQIKQEERLFQSQVTLQRGAVAEKKEFIHFLNIALGSAYECVPLLEISKRQEYFSHESHSELIDELHKISAKVSALKNSLRK